ncbi:Mobile element protein [Dissulfuribacter thermophilus]|uniref:Mobile element protein n=1 Tax=Dissulfuribacter thermophilus TaxID=1156395 RepID=A0A1B9F2G7_9BACT|nr:Mobile element protein [Dissulfuribacter thermophilus]
MLLEDEYSNRASNSYIKRLRQSKLDPSKGLEAFDFSFQPKLNKKKILDLQGLRFITEKENIIFMGNPGVGKTHLANALGLEALKRGYKVKMLCMTDMLTMLTASRGDGTYNKIFKELVSLDLLIIDEIGFKKVPQDAVDEFFEIVKRRHENGSIIITTNRSFEDWANVFGDQVLASAIIDRLVHHCHIIKIIGPSYRMKNLKEKIPK